MQSTVRVLQVFFVLGIGFIHDRITCARFPLASTVGNNEDSTLKLSFAINNTCHGQYEQVQQLVLWNVQRGQGQPLCLFVDPYGSSQKQQYSDCVFDPQSNVITVTRPKDQAGEGLKLVCHLRNDTKFTEKVTLPSLLTTTTLTVSPAETTSPSGQSRASEDAELGATTAAETNAQQDSTFPRESQVMVMVAGCAVGLLVIVLTVTCCLGKRLAAIKKRRSLIGCRPSRGQHAFPQNPYVVSNTFYRGSNVSLNIVNDIYESSVAVNAAGTDRPADNVDRDVPPRCDVAIHVPTGAARRAAVVSDEGDYAEIK